MRNGISHLLFFISVWGVNLVVFIVSDQRIATENFEKGKIYKVVFLDESIFYGVCLGIGSNFVMLSGNISGYLFPLTMETASQVESIDLYTPVEPKPPVPPMTNLLQYQIGLPPFSFNTSGTNLWSYYIKGNTIQDGTPTPAAPVPVQGVGTLDALDYKIPISSANTTTLVYLGEVQTTRKIKKLVLTGNETGWTKNDSIAQSNAYYRIISGYYRYNGLCSHYATVDDVRAETGVFFGGNINYLTTLSDAIDTVDKWKTYLQQQYSAGTPVTVWYVLATEETAVVNEPLQKIGDYADSLTSEQAGIQIPTIVGDNTLSVNTTVQPSEMQIVYKIADC